MAVQIVAGQKHAQSVRYTFRASLADKRDLVTELGRQAMPWMLMLAQRSPARHVSDESTREGGIAQAQVCDQAYLASRTREQSREVSWSSERRSSTILHAAKLSPAAVQPVQQADKS